MDRLSWNSLPLLLSILVPATATTQPDCSCGHYITATTHNSSDQSTFYFTETLETDFTLPQAAGQLTWTSAPGADWQAQVYNVSASAARGPYGKAAEGGNVVLNSGVELWVRSQLLPANHDDDGGGGSGGGGTGQLVPMAEVVSAREDILYVSFRISMRAPGVNGTCAAFFFYHDDEQEIDLEILSRQQQEQQQSGSVEPGQHILNLVIQSPESRSQGYNAAGTLGFHPVTLPFDPTTDFHEYRFDWLPSSPTSSQPRVDFYADTSLLWSTTDGNIIPSSPGALHLIHWSNGDPSWSGGPPGSDAVMRVQWVRAFFNSSSSSTQEDGGSCAGGGGGEGGGGCVVGDGPPPRPPASTTGTAGAGSTATGSSAAAGSAGGGGRLVSGEYVLLSVLLFAGTGYLLVMGRML